MDLTLASALSAEGLLGHMAYVVLVASMLMRTLTWLRVLVIVSALFAIAYGAFVIRDPVTVIWETLLVVVNILQLISLHWSNLRARFTSDERAFVSRHLPGLSRGEARALLDAGEWTRLAPGAVFTNEGAPVEHLVYIAQGEADVVLRGNAVSRCRPGDFIGEMTALTGLPATASVRAAGEVLIWRISAARLRDILRRREALEREMDAAFARSYRDKLVDMNARAAASGTSG
ncbi:cyclic nucleotide-binding domain-containing protein [Roseibacterium sp. SDUM158017]|uniref:cyclic nucleotide-binding domain-containing protein n=1 Tax=Roseicyclus salinarum TaxID=3036773 RepID=UPI002414FE46|nr:cyclic nucleotide-binding domain-containing protein [Roseibacterium sp. SDUM158017]MDG4648771.1 cyclic nucleotide-binding domain-containing protein [Roseibacterium sp. SDUM158017]